MKTILLFVCGVVILVLFIDFPEIKQSILQIINPEYYAIKEVLDVFKD